MINILILLAGLSLTEEVRLIEHFIENQTEKHWSLDRLSNKNLISVASTGVGFYAFARASQLDMITKEKASLWIREGFDHMLAVNRGNNGWLYHFVTPSGSPYNNSEVSSIDTVIFYVAAERAVELINDQLLLQHIRRCKGEISLSIMMDGNLFYHGWKLKDGRREILQNKWKNYDEGVLIYKYFNIPFKPAKTVYDLPLFCYFYPLAFFSDELWIDNLGKAIDFQLAETGRFGFSALDGRNGYVINSPYYVSPVGIYSCNRYFPSKCQNELRKLNVSRLIQSVSTNGKWWSNDRILLDDGILLMLLGKL